MKHTILSLALAAALVACTEKGTESHDHDDDGHDHGHAHEPKHGGTLIELGDHEAFAEVKLDHDAGKATLWIYIGEDMKPGEPDTAPILNLMAGDKPKQLTATKEGDHWIFSDAALESEPENARLRLVIAGKTHQPPLEHDHDHDGE
jgi:hypothetical protein